MSNEVILRALSVIQLKYVGDTGVCTIPCTVTDIIDQGVVIADGRFSDEEVWEGDGVIISPAIPDGTKGTFEFNDPMYSPANPAYVGSTAVDFSEGPETKYMYFLLSAAPPL